MQKWRKKVHTSYRLSDYWRVMMRMVARV